MVKISLDWEMLSDGEQECEYNQFENTILPKQRQKLTKRTTLFKNSHPGSLSHLRKAQREQLQKCISTFIHDTIPDLEDGCFAINSLSGKPEVGLPEALVDDFYEWFDDQLAR